ncbi:MAG: hypothetical protein M3512_04765 [Bacteroidota bacterium]|nr:hypothetical protein [Bacteroidota bacterium]
MTIKILVSMTIIFVFQVLASCMPCNCPKPETFEIHYNSVDLTPLNTAKFNDIIVEDSVPLNAFGLQVAVDGERIKVSDVFQPTYNFGFSPAMACKCNQDQINYLDKVSMAEIFLVDIETDEHINISALFRAYSYYDNKQITLEEYFKENISGAQYFRFDLVEYENIPKKGAFMVEIELESGLRFSNQTKEIIFYSN